SRLPLVVAFVFFSFSLALIDYSTTIFVLIAAICLFSFFMRILNIAMNTQSITLQQKFEKRIVGSFHGLWSTGGLIGVIFSTLMIKFNISMQMHVLLIALLTLVVSLACYKYSLSNDKSVSGNKLILGKPDTFILYLGFIIFFAAMCEGGMFDWSGIYFKEIVKEDVFTYGYLTFMATMALSRFFSDRIIQKIGMQNTYLLSALFIAAGISVAVFFPYFWPALFGFCLVGFGTAPIFPLTFALAGTSKKYSPGMAISIISTYATVGFLLGPPLIGYLSHAFGLQNAFLVFVLA